MERYVEKIAASYEPFKEKISVAAYARVSSGKDAMLHSLATQVRYYTELVGKNKNWRFAGVYADEAYTGTKDARPEFQRLLADCKAGKVQKILTKSISRFARNTVILLEVVRELKELEIDVFFEKENLHSLSGDGELMLSILASFAQAESLAVSENCKWRVRRNFQKGKPGSLTILGYRRTDSGNIVVDKKEAKIVKRIFALFLAGKGKQAIANILNEEQVPSRTKKNWHASGIAYILRNEKYIGTLLLQKTYIDNHLSKRKRLNDGALPKYLVEQHHEPIINIEDFIKVQELLKHKTNALPKCSAAYIFTGKITCGHCGKHFKRRTTAKGHAWICSTVNYQGKKHCPLSKQIPEEILYATAAEALGIRMFVPEVFTKEIQEILVNEPNALIYVFRDGKQIKKVWQDRSRRASWTEEKRRLASCKSKKQKLQ